jgi:molybdate transport system substrate-binding protein
MGARNVSARTRSIVTLAAVLIGIIVAVGGAGVARAAEIKLLCPGAMRSVVSELVAKFESDTGHKVALESATAGALARRIGEGAAFDVAIITPALLDELTTAGKLVRGSRVDLAKVGMGLAVKEGAALPDIATVDAFKRVLLAAKSVAYIDPQAGGSSGIYFDKLLDRLGIGEQIRAKAKLRQGGYVAELVANGEAELAVHQISEIVPVKGVVLAGALPMEIQNTTVYAAAIGPTATDASLAKSLVSYLAGPNAAPILKRKGMEKP